MIILIITQLKFTCSKSTIETLEKSVKYMFKVNHKYTRRTSNEVCLCNFLKKIWINTFYTYIFYLIIYCIIILHHNCKYVLLYLMFHLQLLQVSTWCANALWMPIWGKTITYLLDSFCFIYEHVYWEKILIYHTSNFTENSNYLCYRWFHLWYCIVWHWKILRLYCILLLFLTFCL